MWWLLASTISPPCLGLLATKTRLGASGLIKGLIAFRLVVRPFGRFKARFFDVPPLAPCAPSVLLPPNHYKKSCSVLNGVILVPFPPFPRFSRKRSSVYSLNPFPFPPSLEGERVEKVKRHCLRHTRFKPWLLCG